jgi:hypothetical protein
MRRGGRIDMTKPIVAFRSFANAPNYSEKNVSQCLSVHHRSNLNQPGVLSPRFLGEGPTTQTEPWARLVLRNDFYMLVAVLLVTRSRVGVRVTYKKILKPI